MAGKGEKMKKKQNKKKIDDKFPSFRRDYNLSDDEKDKLIVKLREEIAKLIKKGNESGPDRGSSYSTNCQY